MNNKIQNDQPQQTEPQTPASQQNVPPTQPQSNFEKKMIEYTIPINRSGLAIAAGYVSLLNIVFPLSFIFAPVTLILAAAAMRDLKKNPTKKGMGRVYFACIMSLLGAVGFILLIIH